MKKHSNRPHGWGRIGFAALLAATFSASAADSLPDTFGVDSPFFLPSSLPFQAPPFDKIKDQDYQPAIEAGIAQEQLEMQKIAEDPAAPTFENTIVPMERSGLLLARATAAFNAVTQANINATLQAAKTAIQPKLAAHADAIHLNDALFARVAAVYRQRGSRSLDPESRRLVEFTYAEFVHAGANLSAADKDRLKAFNTEAATLSNAFSQKVLAATSAAAYVAPSKTPLAGFTDAQLAQAAQAAHGRDVGGYLVPLQNTTQQPDLASLQDRATRQQIFERSWNRAELGDSNDTRGTVGRLAQLRAQRAKLLGYASHAAWKLEDQMAKTPKNALAFMDALVPLATAKAAREAAAAQALLDARHGGFQMAAWDWSFYGEQVRREKYDLDESQIKPYFELNNVLINGVFYAATQLYGITFNERKDIPVYQSDVRVFDVIDADGKPLALFYCDYFKRDNKQGGAWMSHFVGQSQLLGTRPAIYNVANFPNPAQGDPALISFEDVTTMFHEFGHALHGIFADTRYPSLSGTSTARDFVEFPSQFNEHWALYPSVFKHYAIDYKTGAPMPPELVERIKKSASFGEGYRLTELLAAAELDMQWHLLSADAPPQDPDAFEKTALARTRLDLRLVPPRYRSSYFSHIWSSGYSAGYYAYLWTQMLCDDAYAWFDQHGGLTRANGERFRRMVLVRGNTQDLAALYATWRGRAPSVVAMKKYRGLAANAP